MENLPSSLFGKIAIAAGYLTEAKLQTLLEAQAEERKAGVSVTLGELARERRIMTSEQVQRTLLVQEFTLLRESGKRFGALAVKKGILTEEQVSSALEEQRKEYQSKSKVPPRLEEILLEAGTITGVQIEALNEVGPEGEQASAEAAVARPPAPEEVTGALSIEGGARYPLGKKSILGRLPTCDVVLDEPRCSRQHARIQFDPGTGRHVITDLNTPNGTRVNDKRISGIVLLNPGDKIGIGALVLRYENKAPSQGVMSLDETRIGVPKGGAAVDPNIETVVAPPSKPPQAGRPPRKV